MKTWIKTEVWMRDKEAVVINWFVKSIRVDVWTLPGPRLKELYRGEPCLTTAHNLVYGGPPLADSEVFERIGWKNSPLECP